MLKKSRLGAQLQAAAGKLFSAIPLSPNQITVLALVFAIIAAYFAYLGQPIAALLFFIIAGATDAIDGAVARARNEVTARGAYIDGIIDRLVEFLMILSFAFFALPSVLGIPISLALVLYLFFGSCMTSFSTAYAEHRKVADAKKIASQPGILPRAERLILLFLALALVPFAPLASSAIITIGALLCIVTFAQRFAYYSK